MNHIFLPFLIGLFCLFGSVRLHAQSTYTITKEATTYTNDASVGSTSFSNPSNAGLADGNRAVATTTITLFGSTKTNFLKATNFNFSIPPVAVITAVLVRVRKRAGGVINLFNYVSDAEAKLIVEGTVTQQNKATTTHWPNSDAVEEYSFDVADYGTPLSVTDVNSSNFGIAFSAAYTGVAGVIQSAEIDQIQMTVTYTLTPLPIKLLSFSTSNSKQGVRLNWVTGDGEAGDGITLERSRDNQTWAIVFSERLTNSTIRQEYQYEDKLIDKGVYYYRLKLNSANGKSTYSPVRPIQYTQPQSLTLYPSLASSFVIILNSEGNEAVTVHNLQQQLIKVPVIVMSEKRKQLNIQHLTPGIYFVKIKEGTFRFIKE
jgi:hypothetical protein